MPFAKSLSKCNDQRSRDTRQEAQKKYPMNASRNEKHYPLGDRWIFPSPEPDEEYILTLCGDTVISAAYLRGSPYGWTNRAGNGLPNRFQHVFTARNWQTVRGAAATQQATISKVHHGSSSGNGEWHMRMWSFSLWNNRPNLAGAGSGEL